MAKRAKPIEPPQPEVKAKGSRRIRAAEPLAPGFAVLEKEHRWEAAEEQSGKRARPEPGPTVTGGSRAGKPRSGRSGSDSNASPGTRGH